MKKIIIQFVGISASLFSFFLFYSCKEIPPIINTQCGNGTTGTFTDSITTSQKNVLLEDFTGVRCVNCPYAHDEAKNISEVLHPGRVNVVALHSDASFFAVPIPTYSHQSFLTTEAQSINNYIGPTTSYPMGAVDRKQITGSFPAAVIYQNWSAQVASALADNLEVNLTIALGFDSTTRQLSVKVRANYTVTQDTANRITVLICENNIIDAQLIPAGAFPCQVNTGLGVCDTCYQQDNVLRKSLSSATGDDIALPISAGDEKIFFYNVTLPANWVAKNCKVVAFVSENRVVSKHVLQSVQLNLPQ